VTTEPQSDRTAPARRTRIRSRQERLLSRNLVGVSLAYFMVLLDITVLAVAEPDIIASLHTDVVGVGWATTSYTICLAASLVLAGSLADRYGSSRVFTLGVLGFGGLSVVCALSPSITALVVARALLGLCAAAIVPSSMALIAHDYADRGLRARAIAIWASISGSAMAAGPLLGGLLVTEFGWRAVFVINAPIALLVLLLSRPRSPVTRSNRRSIDPVPHLLVAATLAGATFAVTELGQGHLGLAAGAGTLAAALAAATVHREARSPSPIVPPALRASTGAWRAFGWGAAVNMALTSLIFTLPLALGTTPLVSGLVLLPMTLTVAVNPILTGRIVAARGPRLPIQMGLATLAAGTAATAAALHRGPGVVLALSLLACGLGVSWALPALVAYAVSHAPADVAGSVGGILNATRQCGATLGAAISGALITIWPSGAGATGALLVAAAVTLAATASAGIRRSAPRVRQLR
jgi:DHA2 family methylenomycin A resistance protein-like MFS transporter